MRHLGEARGQTQSRAAEMMEVERAKRKALLPPELVPTARMPPNIPPPTFTPLQPVTPQINPSPVIPAPIAIPEPIRGRVANKEEKEDRTDPDP